VRDGAMVVVFKCLTPHGQVIPEVYFGVTVVAGWDASFPEMPRESTSEVMIVIGVVRASDMGKIFRSPPAFRGPYLYTPRFKPAN
jgi:hypothetical protein